MARTVSSTGERLKACVLEAIDRAERLLRGKTRHAGIHDARKAIRRARAALRLVREPLGATVSDAFDELGDLGESLSEVRDAHVAVGTLQSLAASARSADERECLRRAGRIFGTRRATRLAGLLAADPAFAARRARLRRVHDALAALDWSGLTPHVLRSALAHGVDRTGRIGRSARATRDDELRHLWRRRLRRLRYQFAALDAALGHSPAPAAAWAWPARRGRPAVKLAVRPSVLRALAGRLGREHDLVMLRAALLDAAGIERADRALARRIVRRAIAPIAAESDTNLAG